MESCAINIYLWTPCFVVFFFPPLRELLGDGRDPIATAAFLLLAVTEKGCWWLACCGEGECTPSGLDLQRVNWNENKLKLSIAQWQKKIAHRLPSLSQMRLNVGNAMWSLHFLTGFFHSLFSAVFINWSFKAVPAMPAPFAVWCRDVVQST